MKSSILPPFLIQVCYAEVRKINPALLNSFSLGTLPGGADKNLRTIGDNTLNSTPHSTSLKDFHSHLFFFVATCIIFASA